MESLSVWVKELSSGNAGNGIPVRLERPVSGYEWEFIGGGLTDRDGRIEDLLPKRLDLPAGTYRIVLEVEDFFREVKIPCAYPFIQIVFETERPGQSEIQVFMNPKGFEVRFDL